VFPIDGVGELQGLPHHLRGALAHQQGHHCLWQLWRRSLRRDISDFFSHLLMICLLGKPGTVFAKDEGLNQKMEEIGKRLHLLKHCVGGVDLYGVIWSIHCLL